MLDREAEEVLEFWFGELDAAGRADAAHRRRWFVKDPAFDDEVTSRFIDLHDQVAAGKRDHWLAVPRGRLALIVTLDQFSRNMFRGTAKMFAFDDKAFQAASQGVQAGVDRQLRHDERTFLYMPFMHREDRAAQERCVELFSTWARELAGELQKDVENGLNFAVLHRDIVQRFGRFPHRNAIVGRSSSSDEVEFLKQPNSSF